MARLASMVRRRRAQPSDDGTAVLEFVVLAVLVMIPIAYAVLVLINLHAGTFGVTTAAREAGRAYVTADSPGQASLRARRAAEIAMADQGLPAPKVTIRCLGGACLAPGSRVLVEVTATVEVPFVPTKSGTSQGTIPVTATHETTVDTYRDSS